jgi:hypothetical protein
MMLAVALWRNHSGLALDFERFNHSLIRIVGFISKHRIGD